MNDEKCLAPGAMVAAPITVSGELDHMRDLIDSIGSSVTMLACGADMYMSPKEQIDLPKESNVEVEEPVLVKERLVRYSSQLVKLKNRIEEISERLET